MENNLIFNYHYNQILKYCHFFNNIMKICQYNILYLKIQFLIKKNIQLVIIIFIFLFHLKFIYEYKTLFIINLAKKYLKLKIIFYKDNILFLLNYYHIHLIHHFKNHQNML